MEDYATMKKISTKTAINDGGREGKAYTPNHDFEVSTSMMDKKGVVTPELLFAAGFASCFNGAMTFPLQAAGKGDAKSEVRAEVSLYTGGDADFQLSVNVIGHIDGMSKEETLEFMQKAEQICPYAKATKGNIKVTLEAE